MQPEDIAIVFDDWEKRKSYEWQYAIDDKTYKEQPCGLFKQALPLVSTPVAYPSSGEEVFVISDLHIASGRPHWREYAAQRPARWRTRAFLFPSHYWREYAARGAAWRTRVLTGASMQRRATRVEYSCPHLARV